MFNALSAYYGTLIFIAGWGPLSPSGQTLQEEKY
jgi:hypothetical protein